MPLAAIRVLLLALGFSSAAALAHGDMASYVAHVLTVIERDALATDVIDWLRHRESVLGRAADAREMAEAYELIDETLVLLGDGHSFLQRPRSPVARTANGALGGYAGANLHHESLTVLSVYPGSPAEAAGLVRGDRIISVNEVQVAPGSAPALHVEAGRVGTRLLVLHAAGETREIHTSPKEFRSGIPPAAYWFTEGIAVLELPEHSGSGLVAGAGDYAGLAHQGLREHADACGWIVDLRLNTGGNMWPMLAAAGPLLGEGELGSFVFRDGEQLIWTYRQENARTDGTLVATVSGAPDFVPLPPVAVLTSGRTASSGEALVVAFRGRSNSRSFGGSTRGVPTVNRTIPLPDGAVLLLTVGRFADRSGRAYEGPLEPDEPVLLRWEAFGTPRDPLLQAAGDWLLGQPDCQ